MIYIIWKKSLFVFMVLIQILNISATDTQDGSYAEVFINTEYATEKFHYTWKIANFSRIFNAVHADFFLENSSTTWRLLLDQNKIIYLERVDIGEPVYTDLQCTLMTRHEKFQVNKFYQFERNYRTTVKLFNLEEEQDNMSNTQTVIQFEEDIFNMFCAMNILGPPITKVTRSSECNHMVKN